MSRRMMERWDEQAFISVIVRRGRHRDAPRLTEIALAAKQYWGYPSHWIELWRNQLTIDADYVEQNPVYVAEVEGKTVGFYALESVSSAVVSLEHLWVLPQAMQHGVGRKLTQHAIEWARAEGAQLIEIESDPNAEGFYRRMGARCVGQVTYDLAGSARQLPLLHLKIE